MGLVTGSAGGVSVHVLLEEKKKRNKWGGVGCVKLLAIGF